MKKLALGGSQSLQALPYSENFSIQKGRPCPRRFGQYRKGEVGLSIDMGRPGMDVFLRDAKKVAMAVAKAGFELVPPGDTPLAALMTKSTSKNQC